LTTPEAFAITCVTCGSRLKVNSRSLIGSIESCPKCGAMVQIAAPTDEAFGLVSADSTEHVVIGQPNAVDSDAITQSAVAEIGPAAVPGRRPTFSDPLAGSGGVTPPPITPLRMPQSDVAATASATQAEEATEYRRELDGAWQNESTQRTKQLVLVALISLFGLIAATVVFSQFVRTWRGQQGGDEQVATVVPPVEPADAVPTELADDVESASEQIKAEPSSELIAPAATPEPMQTEVARVPPAVTDTGIPPLKPTPFELPLTDSSKTDSPKTGAPRAISDDQNKPVDNASVADSAPPQMKNLPPGLLQYVPLLSLETTENQTARPLQAPPTIDVVRIDAAADDEATDDVSRPKRKPIDVEKSLALRFAIDNKNASLAELTLLISQLTTVPIEIELISLDAAGVRVEAAIKTPGKVISMRDWIDAVCLSIGMVSQASDDRIMISASDAGVDAGIGPALQLDDFGVDAPQVFGLISPILLDEPRIVDGEAADADAPLPTKLSDDGRSIVPGLSLQSRMRAALAIEAVRLMRGMPPKLDRWRTSRWMGAWPANSVAADASSFGDWPVVNDGRHGPTLDSPRANADLLRSLATTNQSQVLVGWYDATRRGLYPADPVMPYTDQPTAAAMLDEIIGEQGLQTRVCGPSLWYICSEASYDRFEVIAWYSIPPGSEADLRLRLANSLNLQDATTMPIAFDENRMLIRCPRYLARQIQRIITQTP